MESPSISSGQQAMALPPHHQRAVDLLSMPVKNMLIHLSEQSKVSVDTYRLISEKLTIDQQNEITTVVTDFVVASPLGSDPSGVTTSMLRQAQHLCSSETFNQLLFTLLQHPNTLTYIHTVNYIITLLNLTCFDHFIRSNGGLSSDSPTSVQVTELLKVIVPRLTNSSLKSIVEIFTKFNILLDELAFSSKNEQWNSCLLSIYAGNAKLPSIIGEMARLPRAHPRCEMLVNSLLQESPQPLMKLCDIVRHVALVDLPFAQRLWSMVCDQATSLSDVFNPKPDSACLYQQAPILTKDLPSPKWEFWRVEEVVRRLTRDQLKELLDISNAKTGEPLPQLFLALSVAAFSQRGHDFNIGEVVNKVKLPRLLALLSWSAQLWNISEGAAKQVISHSVDATLLPAIFSLGVTLTVSDLVTRKQRAQSYLSQIQPWLTAVLEANNNEQVTSLIRTSMDRPSPLPRASCEILSSLTRGRHYLKAVPGVLKLLGSSSETERLAACQICQEATIGNGTFFLADLVSHPGFTSNILQILYMHVDAIILSEVLHLVPLQIFLGTLDFVSGCADGSSSFAPTTCLPVHNILILATMPNLILEKVVAATTPPQFEFLRRHVAESQSKIDRLERIVSNAATSSAATPEKHWVGKLYYVHTQSTPAAKGRAQIYKIASWLAECYVGSANCESLASKYLQLWNGLDWRASLGNSDLNLIDRHFMALAASVCDFRQARFADYLRLSKVRLALAMPMLLSRLPKEPFDQMVDAVGFGEISKYRRLLDQHQKGWLHERLSNTTEKLVVEILALQQSSEDPESQQKLLLDSACALKERIQTHRHHHFLVGMTPPDKLTWALTTLVQPEKKLNPFEEAIPKSLLGRAVANHEYLKGPQGHYRSYVIDDVLIHYKIQQDKEPRDLDQAEIDLTTVYAILFALVENIETKTLPGCDKPKDREVVKSRIIAALEEKGIQDKKQLLEYFTSYQ